MKRVALGLAAMGLLCLAADQALAQRIVSRSTTTSRIVTSNRISGTTVQSYQQRSSYSNSGRSTRSTIEYRTPTWRRPTVTVYHGRSSSVVRQPSFDDRIQNYLPPNVNRFLGPSLSITVRF